MTCESGSQKARVVRVAGLYIYLPMMLETIWIDCFFDFNDLL